MTEETVETTNSTETAPEQAQQTTPPELNINDLVAMRSLIDVVTQRGAFKATELSGVGMLFDKLNRFVEAAQQQQTPAQGE
jgi:hypothetical protein